MSNSIYLWDNLSRGISGFSVLPETIGALSVYAVVGLEPALVLDFDDTYYRTGGTDTDLVSAATHARASTATYTDASGILQTASINEPRVGHHIYNGSAWVDEGYFHESEARTNLLTYSSEFDNVDWTKNLNVSITANAIVSPDGTTNADLAEQTGGTFTAVSQPITLVSGSTYTLSLFMKANTAATARLRVISGSTDANLLAIDLENGTSSSYQAEDYGSGWFRYALSFVADGTTGLVFIYPADSSADLGSTGIYGAQVEAGSTPSSYIPTAGATVTRAADTLTVPAANLPYSATAMSIQMEGTMTGVSSTFANWTEDASNGILMQSGASNFTFTQEAAGVVDTVTGGSYTSGINVPFNIASRHGSTFINGAVDGTALTADTTPVALPDLLATDMDIGSTFMGTIKLFRVWADDLTDAGNEEATT